MASSLDLKNMNPGLKEGSGKVETERAGVESVWFLLLLGGMFLLGGDVQSRVDIVLHDVLYTALPAAWYNGQLLVFRIVHCVSGLRG